MKARQSRISKSMLSLFYPDLKT